MSDWWSKKLAGEKPTTQRSFEHRLPSSVPVTPPVNPTHTQAPQQPAQVPQQEPENLSQALRMGITKGGEGTRRDGNLTCPSCGGHYVFSRSKGNTVGGASPAPRCYECGWNGMYDQGNWG
jgi:hypothetical protein